MPPSKNTILVRMLDRLYAGLASGPNLNCRPHSSRQRLDWTQLARLQDIDPADALCQLLSEAQAVKLQARVSPPRNAGKPGKKRPGAGDAPPAEPGTTGSALPDRPIDVDSAGSDPSNGDIANDKTSTAERQQRDHWTLQQGLLTKLRGLAEDSRDYEQDTGVHVLHVGFPLLSLPPGTAGSKRLLAPIAFIPVSLELRAGLTPVIEIAGLHDGSEFLAPNEALFAWLERQTGQQLLPESAGGNGRSTAGATGSTTTDATNGIDDTDGSGDGPSSEASAEPEQESRNLARSTATAPSDPWQELNELVRRVATALQFPPVSFTAKSLTELRSAPRADDTSQAEIVPAAVLGLFPMNNQGLLRDMQAMVTGAAALHGPVQSFLSSDALLDAPGDEPAPATAAGGDAPERSTNRQFDTERLVTAADPCQAHAVSLARECQGLVIHGPPGTGKSQTITNIIGDHLARGERVLLVCDKRTALDVVARRLEHLGLGSLCALIHDPQRDQRNLYMQIREQLEELNSLAPGSRAKSRIDSLNRQLQSSHDTLARAWSLVMSPDPQRHVSFHDRMGEWLETALPSLATSATTPGSNGTRAERRPRDIPGRKQPATEPATMELLDANASQVRDVVHRAIEIGLTAQPWNRRAGLPLARFLELPASQLRDDMAAILEAATPLDKSPDCEIPPILLPQNLEQTHQIGDAPQPPRSEAESRLSFQEQLTVRQELAAGLKRALAEIDPAARKQWAQASDTKIEHARHALQEAAAARAMILSTPLEAELRLILRGAERSITEIASQIGILESYLTTCDAWYFWFAFGIRRQANAVMQAYGLPPARESALRLRTFLNGVMARMLVADVLDQHSGTQDLAWKKLDDAALQNGWDRLDLVTRILRDVSQHPALAGLSKPVRETLAKGNTAFLAGLQASLPRLAALDGLRSEMVASQLFHGDWLRDAFQRLCRGESILSELKQLAGSLDELGEILRIRRILAAFPAPLRRVIEQSIAGATDLDAAMNAIRHRVLSDDIDAWLKSCPDLQALDGVQLTSLHREIWRLEREKQPYVRDLILEQWIGRQRERLLASTGSRLNSLGADLRRRLTTRGERAMRLRQVITVGGRIEGGDPLFDLRPVWMASPETVAQIFPRDALFDVVVFDEASQCRLEEALPVLTRARRVVIAGDPKQLPPTRFFESAMITSDNPDADTDQELFEVHQSEVEDLLTAALSLDIQESHLDVHYRSRNADLVEFSNQHFYGSRLQAIPGHPRNRIRFAPISLYQVKGIYEERANPAEAAQVVKIVADLLRRSEPPSIGIACFNLTQRDLILDALAELAAEDDEFAAALAAARCRVGSGAFEGLFVKNLENVQGDERDHMIISTTYGPDRQGRFYRRFGPLGQAGGGRRLNVLVTRARQEVHLVTSIPPDLYRNLAPIPEGLNPGGGWLLFAYLDYAERLAQAYGQWRANAPDTDQPVPARTVERPSRAPSQFARHLARLVATQHDIGSDIHWGNDGFCVDVAFHHPRHPEDRTLGLLCDGTRFQYAHDPVAWDVFRMAILEEQGWQLSRCWSPQFFRDPEHYLRKFIADASRIADTDPDPEGIAVEPEQP